jgi:hypothetical protein
MGAGSFDVGRVPGLESVELLFGVGVVAGSVGVALWLCFLLVVV